MRTLNIDITEKEFIDFKFKKERFNLSELIDIILRKSIQNDLKQSVEQSMKSGLSEMSMDEINAEIREYRTNAKSNN